MNIISLQKSYLKPYTNTLKITYITYISAMVNLDYTDTLFEWDG